MALRIVADARIAALDATFARRGGLLRLDGREISRDLVKNADALITRTVTRVDRDLLGGTAVQFVGTATIGTDHLDTDWLDSEGIRWAAAPGCNADATAQYTLAMHLLACRRLGLDPLAQRFGIVGCGNVGGRLKRLAESLGIEAIASDPPLEAQGATGFCSLDQVLDCNVISLHVPLTRSGRWPTWRMFNRAVLERLSTDTLLVNASRGDVVDGPALADWMHRGGKAALDVWPGEPDIEPQLIESAVVATPHIAGYSLEGKLRATSMIFHAFCEHFRIDGCEDPGPPPGPTLDLATVAQPGLADIVLRVCPVERDDRAMRERLDCPPAERIRAYDALRSHYPERREFASWSLCGRLEPRIAHGLETLGFSLISR